MSTRTFAVVLAAGLSLAAALFVLGAALDVPALEYAGAAAVLVVLLARVVWQFAPGTRRSPGRSGAVIVGAALVLAIVGGFVAQRLFG